MDSIIQTRITINSRSLAGLGLEQARKKLHFMAAQHNLPKKLFWHAEDGSPINAQAKIRFVSSKGRVSLICDKGHQDLLIDSTPALHKAIIEAYGKCTISSEVNQMSLSLSDQVHSYRVNSFVIGANKETDRHFLAAPAVEQHQIIRNRLLRDFRTEAETWGIDTSALDLLDPSHFFTKDVTHIPTVATGSATKRGMLRVSVDFLCPLELHGTWQIGRLKNRGHGVISRVKELA